VKNERVEKTNNTAMQRYVEFSDDATKIFSKVFTMSRLIWLLCLAPLFVISGSSTYRLFHFYLFSTQLYGTVESYGVETEHVGLMGPGKPSSDIQLKPWIEASFKTKDNKRIVCRAAGQYSIFDRYISDDIVVLKSELENLLTSNKNVMVLYVKEDAMNQCAVSRGFTPVSFLFFCIALISGVGFLTVLIKSTHSTVNFFKNHCE
jgi:hypothetical protein